MIKLLCCTHTPRTTNIVLHSTLHIYGHIYFLTKARRMSSDLFLIICHNFLWHFDLYVTLGFFLNCGLWDSLWAFYWNCTEKPSTVHNYPIVHIYKIVAASWNEYYYEEKDKLMLCLFMNYEDEQKKCKIIKA